MLHVICKEMDMIYVYRYGSYRWGGIIQDSLIIPALQVSSSTENHTNEHIDEESHNHSNESYNSTTRNEDFQSMDYSSRYSSHHHGTAPLKLFDVNNGYHGFSTNNSSVL